MNKSVMKCCICNNENMRVFITINDKKYHLCCIEQLQQENQELKRNCNIGYENLNFYREENQKYKEVIDKLRKICSKVPYDWSICGIDVVHKIENILKEVE